MINILIYILVSIVLTVLCVRMGILIKKKSNPFSIYFLGIGIIFLVSELLGLVLLLLYQQSANHSVKYPVFRTLFSLSF
jgi:hypothetical protein